MKLWKETKIVILVRRRRGNAESHKYILCVIFLYVDACICVWLFADRISLLHSTLVFFKRYQSDSAIWCAIDTRKFALYMLYVYYVALDDMLDNSNLFYLFFCCSRLLNLINSAVHDVEWKNQMILTLTLTQSENFDIRGFGPFQ